MKPGTIKLAPSIELPLEVVTETFTILAKRGVGKTYTALKLCEQFLEAGQQVVIIDTVGVCWGLRSNAAGDGDGYPIFIVGGDHGDVPFDEANPSAQAKTLADLAAHDRLSMILDPSHLSHTKAREVVGRFCRHLYTAKGPDRYRTPIHLVVLLLGELPERPLGTPNRWPHRGLEHREEMRLTDAWRGPSNLGPRDADASRK